MRLRQAILPLLSAMLLAQAPDPAAFSRQLRTEAPGVEKLLAEYKVEAARTKAEALLPGQVAPWDESNPPAQLASYNVYRDYLYAYFLAAKATDASGDWEKALDYFQKTRTLASLNTEKVSAKFPAIATYYRGLAERSRQSLVENDEYIKALKSKPSPDAGDTQQLELIQKEEESIAKNLKSAQVFEGYIDTAKKEAAYYTRFADQEEVLIKDLATHLEEYTFKNDKVKFVEGIMASKGYLETQYPEKTVRVRFLYRLRTLDPGSRRVVREIEALTGLQLPLPPEEKPAPKKRRR